MVYSARKREDDFIEREAMGESTLTAEPSKYLITSVNTLWRSAAEDNFYDWQNLLNFRLNINGNDYTVQGYYLVPYNVDEETFCDLIETFVYVSKSERLYNQIDIENMLNIMLERNRYDKRFVDGELVPYSRSLSYQGVKNSFDVTLVGEEHAATREKLLEAMQEFSEGNYSDAITDGATALQMYLALKAFDGKTLGAQVIQAKQSNFISDPDDLLWNWLTKTRNQFSDSHNGTPPTREQAWSFLEILGSVLARYK